MIQHGREKQQASEKIALAGSPYHPGRGKIAPRGGPREPKGEQHGAKMAVKFESKIEIDFQAIFDAKIVRKMMKNLSEKIRISSPVIANIGYNREVMSPRPTCIWTRKTRVQLHFRRMLVISSYLQNH